MADICCPDPPNESVSTLEQCIYFMATDVLLFCGTHLPEALNLYIIKPQMVESTAVPNQYHRFILELNDKAMLMQLRTKLSIFLILTAGLCSYQSVGT